MATTIFTPSVLRGAGTRGVPEIPATATVETRMVMKWTLVDAGDLVVTLWGQSGAGANYSYDVDWGDSSSDTGVTTADKTHTYAGVGTYEVKITGQFAGLKMYSAPTADRNKLTEFSNWGTTEINGLYRMFYYCINMEYTATDAPDITSLTATSGTQARELFSNCSSIENLDLSNWTNTYNITSMYYAFSGTSSLLSLNLTGWDTSNVVTMENCFASVGDATTGCEFTLPDLDLTSNSALYKAFSGIKVKSMDVSGWSLRAAGVTSYSLFYDSKWNLGGTTTLDLSSWTNTSGFGDMRKSFRAMTGLTSLNLTGWDTSGITSFWEGFIYDYTLTEIVGLNGLSTAGMTGAAMDDLFYSSYVLDFGTHNFGSNWGPNLGNVTNFSQCFYRVGNVTPGTAAPDVSDWDMSGATYCVSMFQECKHSGNLDVSSWDVTAITTNGLVNMVYKSSTAVFDVSSWELSGGINSMHSFAREATNLTTLDFAHANNDFSAVTTWENFNYNGALTSLTFNANADFSAVTTMALFLYGTAIATADYDALLLRLDATNSNAVVAHFGSSKYTGGGAVATARANLVTKGWTITDGGIA